jgi:hypothetical protein
MGMTGIRHGECESETCSGRHTYLPQPTSDDNSPVAEASLIEGDGEIIAPFGAVFYFDRDRDLAVA